MDHVLHTMFVYVMKVIRVNFVMKLIHVMVTTTLTLYVVGLKEDSAEIHHQSIVISKHLERI